MLEQKLLRLGLLTTVGRNIGDDFIRAGIVHVIQRLAPEQKIISVDIDKHEPYTIYPWWHPIRLCYKEGFKCRRRMGRILDWSEVHLPPLGFTRFDSCDLIIQCGTPVIWEGCRKSEWARYVWRDVFSRLFQAGNAVLNIGGGCCYPWERIPKTLVGNPDEAFIRLMLQSANLTTTRDHVTRELFGTLGKEVRQIPCPALLVAQTYFQPEQPTRKVLVNYMEGGGHYDFDQGIDVAAWEQTMRNVVDHLSAQGWQPMLIAHNNKELEVAARIWPNLPRSIPGSQREYFEISRDAAFGVFNRMHASIAAAGLGIPSVAIGNDARNYMVAGVGLPALYTKEATTEKVLSIIEKLAANRDGESRRLLGLRSSTLREYENCLNQYVNTKRQI